MINYGFTKYCTAESLYKDITAGTNEYGEAELVFSHLEQAVLFSELALSCAKVYVCDEDRYAMQRLAEVLADAQKTGVIAANDLNGTEPQIIAKLTADRTAGAEWDAFRALHAMETAHGERPDGAWRKIYAKKRCIDPYVAGKGRVSALDESFRAQLTEFRAQSQDYWVRGY